MDDALPEIVLFGERLRAAGLPAGPSRMIDFCSAATLLGPEDLYWAGRQTLVSRAEQLAVYDRVFAEFFGAEEQERCHEDAVELALQRLPDAAEHEGASEDAGTGVASVEEVLRRKDFSELTDEEILRVAGLLGDLDLQMPQRRTRRWRSARHGAPDVRRTVADALRTAGEPLAQRQRVRRLRPRRLILLLDVSHSMAEYSRALLMLAHAGVQRHRRTEVFCFGTRLTRLTRQLERSGPEQALAEAAECVLDWDGGTRIGASLKTFLDLYGHSGLARGAVVFICSDGLEQGDPAQVAAQMRRLSLLAHRIVWLNPLSGDEGYEPLARGMRAALPYVDVFSSGHNLASMEELDTLLRRFAAA
jgi:uncharacterized protein with von Willebrand factor type A (vWA) domain